MIEKIKITDVSVLKSIEDGLDKSTLGSSLAPYMSATKGEVWIAYMNNGSRVLAPWQEWGVNRTDAIGVAIISGGKRLMIALDEAKLYWSSRTGSSGATIATDKTIADKDFNGKGNTAAIVASSAFAGEGSNYAPVYCNTYSKGGIDAKEWWLPSIGEIGMMYAHFDAINAAMTRIPGAKQLKREIYWSSTEYSTIASWIVSFGDCIRWYFPRIEFSFQVRPVTSF